MSEPDRPPPPLVVTLAALTVVSGFVDAVSFLGLGHVFTANMTGNVVLHRVRRGRRAGVLHRRPACRAGSLPRRRRRRRTAGATGAAASRNLLLVAMVIEAACTAARRGRGRNGARRRFRVASLRHHRPPGPGDGPSQLGRPPRRGPRHVDDGAHDDLDGTGVELVAGGRDQSARTPRGGRRSFACSAARWSAPCWCCTPERPGHSASLPASSRSPPSSTSGRSPSSSPDRDEFGMPFSCSREP